MNLKIKWMNFLMINNQCYLSNLLVRLYDIMQYDNKEVIWTHKALLEKTALIWINNKDERRKNNYFSIN